MKTKRMLSMLLSLCVLLSCVTIAIPVAAAETELLFEDFEDSTPAKTANNTEFQFNFGNGGSVLRETSDGYAHVSRTKTETAFASNGKMGARWGSVTTGKVQFTFDFLANCQGILATNLMWDNQQVVTMYIRGNKVAAGWNVTNVNNPIGEISEGVWYTAEHIADTDKGTYKVIVKNKRTGDIVASAYDLPFTDAEAPATGFEGVNGFTMASWGHDDFTTFGEYEYLVDNVRAVSGYTEPEDNVLISEDFADNTPATTADGNLQFNFGSGGSVLRNPIDGVAHVSRTISGNSNTSNGKMGARWGSVVSGKMKFTFDIKANCNGVFAGGLMWDNQQNPTIYIKGDTVAAGHKVTNTNNPIGKITQGVWYTVEHIVDADAKTYSVTIKDKVNNAIVCGAYDLPFTDAATVPADNRKGANGFLMASWNPDHLKTNNVLPDGEYEYLVDNIYAEKNYEETEGDLVLVNDNMDGLTLDNLASRGYNFNRATTVSGTISSVDTYGNVIDLSRDSATVGIDKNFTYATKGAYKISFDVYRNGGGNFIVFATDDMTSNNSDNDRTCLLYVTDSNAYLNSSSATGNNPRVSLTNQVPKADWFTVEAILNFGEANTTEDDYKITSIYDKNGQLIASKKIDNLYLPNATDAISSLSRIQILNWSDATTLYVDNLKVSRYYVVPELSNDSVVIEYYDGTKAETITTIKPELASIKLDFGCEVATAGTITLTEENGSTVTLTGTTADNQVYTISHGFLKPNKKYTLNVSGFENNRGNQMAEFTAVINTGAGTLSAEMTSVSEEELANLSQNNTLTVTSKYLNSTETSADLAWIIAYYNASNKLIDTEIETGTATALTYNNALTTNFTVKALTDVDSIKIFLWNGTRDIVPYCKAKLIDKQIIKQEVYYEYCEKVMHFFSTHTHNTQRSCCRIRVGGGTLCKHCKSRMRRYRQSGRYFL